MLGQIQGEDEPVVSFVTGWAQVAEYLDCYQRRNRTARDSHTTFRETRFDRPQYVTYSFR